MIDPPPTSRGWGHAPAVLGAFVRRDFATARSYRFPFFFDAAYSIFDILLWFFLAALVDRLGTTGMRHLEDGYFPFVVVGLVVLRMVESTLGSFAARLRQEQTTGSFEVLMSSPARLSVLGLGSAAYDLLYAAAASAFTLAVAVAFGVRFTLTPESVTVVVLGLPAVLALFAAIGLLAAAFTVVFKQMASLMGLVTMSLALLGGVYFPLDVLPEWLRLLAEAIPFTWAIELLRSALLQGEAQWARLAMLAASAAVLLPVSIAVLGRALDRARRAGTLAQY